MNLSNFSRDKIMSIHWDGVYERPLQTLDGSKRVKTGDIPNMPPSDAENNSELRIMLVNLFFEKADGDYHMLYRKTYINDSTFRKCQKGTLRISRIVLTKFVVGLCIEPDTARELYRILGQPLDLKHNRFDYIVALALRDKDTIDQFDDELVRHGIKSILT